MSYSSFPRAMDLTRHERFIRLPREGELVGRRLTGFSTCIGSYGQGGVGWAGWQIDGGVWMVLPLPSSSGWLIATHQEYGRGRISEPDRRVLSCNQSQLEDLGYRPWQMNYADCKWDELPDLSVIRPMVRKFELSKHGFRIEADDYVRGNLISFEVGSPEELPVWGGSGEPRVLRDNDDLTKGVALMETLYLDI